MPHETTQVSLNMWGETLLSPEKGLEQYQTEIDERYKNNKGYYTVIGLNPVNASFSALLDKSGYGNYIPSGWLVGTHSSKDGAMIVTMHNPAKSWVKEEAL